jgi:thiosulfate dehydrogenase [quinone] large subunit
MAAIHTARSSRTHEAQRDIAEDLAPEAGAGTTPLLSSRAARVVAGLTRLSLGWVFLWAFLDKAFGLGHETARADAWVNGGSPTSGFLGFAAAGPFKELYNTLAGAAWADWLFMAGLAGIGIALLLGVFVNLAAASGALMLVLMWTAVLPPENNPFMDDHLVYALVLVLLALLGAGRYLGLGAHWERLDLVRRTAILR